MTKFIENNSTYALMHNYINEMESGETVSIDALRAIGMTGEYKPKPSGQDKNLAVNDAADFLLSGYSNPVSRNPDTYNILTNNGDGTFTRK